MLRTIAKLAIVASACSLLCTSLAGTARASNYTWTLSGGTGNWFTAVNWNPFGPPTGGNNAFVVNGGTAVIAQSGAACSTLNIGGINTGWVQINGGGLTDDYLQLGTVSNGASGVGRLALNSGTLNTTFAEYIGLSGGAFFTQSGGTNTTADLWLAHSGLAGGIYNLSSGLLNASNEYLGDFGTGNFTQSGGTNTTPNLEFGYGADPGTGVYSLNGGVLNISALTKVSNNNATFQAGGGTLQAAMSFTISLPVNLTEATGDAYFNTNGNTLTLNGALSGSGGLQKIGADILVLTASNTFLGNTTVSAGTLHVSAGRLPGNLEYVSGSGGAGLVVSGGSNVIATGLEVGNNAGESGSYSLGTGGRLSSAGWESVGNFGTGLFLQSGGTNSVATTLYVGNGSGSYGTYVMQGGALAANQESIGLTGSGTFTQSDGTNTVIGGFVLAEDLFSEGTYSLNGGTLTCKQVSGGAGNSFLNLDGGKLVAAPGANSNFISGLSALTVGNSATASYTQSSGSNNVGVLYLGFNASASGAYNLNGSGVLNATSEFIGTSGSGSFTQSGGTNTSAALVVGLEVGASGNYNLNGSGLLICNSNYPAYESIGYQGSGSFTQSGGTNNTNILYIGASLGGNGTYNLNGGTLTCQQFQGGAGTSTLNLDGGVLLPAAGASSNFINGLSTLTVGNNATASYAQSSGGINVGNLYLGFNSGASGSYNLNGSGVLNAAGEFIGYSGSGSFTQSGGTNNANILYIGAGLSGNGTYNLNSGTLICQQIQGGAGKSTLILDGGVLLPAAAAGNSFISGLGTLTVGNNATVSYAQSSNSINVGNLYLGFNFGASGSYNLSGSGVLNATGEFIGYSGSGSFTQSAAINTTVLLQLGQMAGGNGTYNLNGGLLSCGQILGGAGTSTFNFDGGVLQAAAAASSNFMSGLTAAYVKFGGATIDTNRQTFTINQTLLDGGGGGLSVIGGGALILANSNTYAGGTALNGAWLVASNGTQGSATGNGPVAVNSGGLAAGPAGGTITGPVTLGVSALSGIQPGAFFNPGSNTLNLLGGLTIENGSELYYTLNLSSSITAGSNGLPVYGGDLINLGGSSLFVVSGSVAFTSNPILPGDYRLIADVSNSNSVNFAKLAPPTVAGETFAWSTTADPGYIDLVASGVLGMSGGTWVSPVSGSWGTAANWITNLPGWFPVGGTVWFLGAPSSPINVALNGNQTAGALVFNVSNTNGYTLTQGSGGILTLGTAASASIAVLGGSSTISAPIQMAGNVTVSVTSGSSLQIAGLLSETATGTSVTFTGLGPTVFSGTATYTGNTNVYGGTLQIHPSARWSNSLSWQIGGATGAIVVQQGGNNSLANQLCVGLSSTMTGSYTLQAGTLNTNESDIGFNGLGVFTQNGGVHSTQLIELGSHSAAYCSGTYNLSAGSLRANQETIPLGGIGIFNQTGGTNTISAGMTLGSGLGGSYNLNGGILTTGSLSMVGSNAAFNAGGGTFQAGASFNTNLPMTLTAAYGPAVFDGNGYSLALAGSLSGSGGLTAGLLLESNGGTLTLAAQNTYRGATILNAGMLVVANGSLGSATGTNSVTLNGGTLAAGPLGTITGAVYGGIGPHTIAPGAGLPAGQFGTLSLTGGLITNANTTLLFNLGTPVAGGTYSGDLIDLGASALTVGGGTIAFAVNPVMPGDYRLFANLSNSPSLANFTLPGQSGQNYMLSTAVDPGFVDLVDTTSTGTGYYWAATSGDWTNQPNWNPSGWPTSKDNCYIQNGGTAGMSQGSDAGVCGTLYVGTASGSGAVAMSTGVLASATEYIGHSGNGTFSQSGGNHAVSSALFVGYAPGSNGAYALSGSGQLGTIFDEYVGWYGTGVFNQTGGTNTVGNSATEGAVILAVQLGSTGTYNLNGGLLQLYGLSSGSGNAMFDAGGGTFRAMDSFVTSVPMTLTGAYGPAVFDTNGNTLTLKGSISGSGGLEKIGAGTLVLSPPAPGNSYRGGTTVEDGTLIVTNNEAIENGMNLSVGADLSAFGTMVPTQADQTTTAPVAAPVPEPGTPALLAVSAVLLLTYRRWHISGEPSERPCARARPAFNGPA